MTIESGRLVFRPASSFGDFRMTDASGKMRERAGVLTHFKGQFAAVTANELLELEDLINNPRVRENDLQKFFEHHLGFFRMWDFREVFPQICLTREEDGPLIPDFLLVDRELQRSMIVDLKLPTARAVIAKKNRERFASTIEDARAQLLEYRDWFEEAANRKKLQERYGLEILRPRLGMVIGSSATFPNTFPIQRVRSRYPDVEIATYDDVAKSAERRLAIIKSAVRTD
jgi:hypothetical protein